jgi:hypothetical protein
MDDQELLIAEMYNSNQSHFECMCSKVYKTKGHFKRHLKEKHGWKLSTTEETTQSEVDHIAVWRSSFMKLALLILDTEDAYKYGDGDRIFRNAKFEMLCADVAHHTKYRSWLWRMQAYECAILGARDAMEYKWNCTANTHGGKGKNIANDNLVDTLVQKIKKIREQGSNVTFDSARKIALATQIQDDMKNNIACQFPMKVSRSKPAVNKDKELDTLVTELKKGKIFDYIPGREFYAFKRYKDIFPK